MNPSASGLEVCKREGGRRTPAGPREGGLRPGYLRRGRGENGVSVVGATGQLGGVIARKLMASGAKVRALARNRDALASWRPAAEIAAVDLRDVPKLTEACRGVEQIVATANNNMGKGRPARPESISPATRTSAPPRATPASGG